MWNWNDSAFSFLNDPIGPDVLDRQLDEIVHMWIRGVFVNHVLQCRLFPIDIDGCQINAPEDNVLTITSDLFSMNIDFKIICLVDEVLAGHVHCPPRNKR